jgi:hypothetical protein
MLPNVYLYFVKEKCCNVTGAGNLAAALAGLGQRSNPNTPSDLAGILAGLGGNKPATTQPPAQTPTTDLAGLLAGLGKQPNSAQPAAGGDLIEFNSIQSN